MTLQHIADNIRAIRVDEGLTQEDFGKLAGVSQSTVSAWERGESTPSDSNIKTLLESLPYLDEDSVFSKCRGFVAQTRIDPVEYAMVPLYDTVPLKHAKNPEGTFYSAPSWVIEKHPESFFVPLEDDSMNRRIPKGFYVLVDPHARIEDEDVCMVGLEDHPATVRRVRKLNNGIELLPDSVDDTYRPQLYDFAAQGHDHVHIYGSVVWICPPHDFKI